MTRTVTRRPVTRTCARVAGQPASAARTAAFGSRPWSSATAPASAAFPATSSARPALSSVTTATPTASNSGTRATTSTVDWPRAERSLLDATRLPAERSLLDAERSPSPLHRERRPRGHAPQPACAHQRRDPHRHAHLARVRRAHAQPSLQPRGEVRAGGGAGVEAEGGGSRARASGRRRGPGGVPEQRDLPEAEEQRDDDRQDGHELDRRLPLVTVAETHAGTVARVVSAN